MHVFDDAPSFRLPMQATFISDLVAALWPGENGAHHLHSMANHGHVNKMHVVSQSKDLLLQFAAWPAFLLEHSTRWVDFAR